jgi:3-methyladenine DNA glycosylase AlkD
MGTRTKEERIAPESLAREIKSWLEKHRNPKIAAQAQKYFKDYDEVRFYGLATPESRAYSAELWERVKDAWSVADAVRLAERMLPDPYHEMKGLAVLVLLRFRKEFPAEMFERIKGWLEKNYCNSWAAVDILCPDALGTLLERYPPLVEKIKAWTSHPNRWVKRASAVGFIKLAKGGGHLDPIYEVSTRLFPVEDDLIHKANGWLLREAGKADAARLEAFLLRHGPKIPRTTLRYAIERFPQAKRRHLLEATKG